MLRVVVEGWRFLPHSFSIVNEFQCLELLSRRGVTLYHRDLPYWNPEWKAVTGLMAADAEARLRQISRPPPGPDCDVVLRMGFPFDFTASATGRTVVFATSEFGRISRAALAGNQPVAQALSTTDATIITPSRWSRDGVIRSGADPDRVRLVPHGVDARIFQPMEARQRAELRRELGWSGKFIFLNVGAMTPNKGILLALKGLAIVARRHPQARLVLKGLDTYYASGKALAGIRGRLTPAELKLVEGRVAYTGHTRSFVELAQYYQAADAYVAPYSAEGFNMPVLEAAACGLPVLCTKGGSTDDFTTPEFGLAIESRLCKSGTGEQRQRYLAPDQGHLASLMQEVVERPEWVSRARLAGPDYISSRFTWRHVVDQLLPILEGR